MQATASGTGQICMFGGRRKEDQRPLLGCDETGKKTKILGLGLGLGLVDVPDVVARFLVVLGVGPVAVRELVPGKTTAIDR